MPEPVLVALLFADRVLTEQGNLKKTIVGTFTRFFADNFPVSFPPWYLFAAVTNLDKGKRSFTVNLVSNKDQVVLGINGEIKVKEEHTVIELIFPIGKAIFRKLGSII